VPIDVTEGINSPNDKGEFPAMKVKADGKPNEEPKALNYPFSFMVYIS